MISAIGHHAGRFLGWWLTELRGCMPRGLAALVLGARERLEVALEPGAVHFSLDRGGRRLDLGSAPYDPDEPGPAARAARALIRRHGAAREVTLRLPPELVLRTTLDLPVAAAETLREVVAYEMDAATPFSAEEVAFDFAVSGSDETLERLRVEILVARIEDVRAAVAAAHAMGLAPARIAGPAEDEPRGRPLDLLPPDDRPRRSRLVPRLALGLALTAAALGIATLALWFDRKATDLERSGARLAELRREAGAAAVTEERLERLAALSRRLAEKKRAEPRMVELIDEMARLLPDGHWLADWEFADGAVRLSGYSQDASAVLRLLEGSDLLTGAAFTAPLTMDPRIGSERFSMTVTVVERGADE